MDSTRNLLIVGGGVAGAAAAEAARSAGYDGDITLVGAETMLPYERPPLSKEVLRGEAEADSAREHDDGFYAAHSVDLVLGSAVDTIDLGAGSAHLAGGASVRFDAIVLSVGARPRTLDIPGADLDGVHYLRTADDAVRLRHAIAEGRRVAVVGAGWIGSEVAASARQSGADVVLIEPAPVPLHRVLGEQVGRTFADLHADHGVQLRLGVGVNEFQGGEFIEKVVLSDGRVEPADVVVVGVGVVPNVELARSAGVDVDNGVVVDQYLRASVPGVYAAGDVANAWHPHYRRHIRVEHVANGRNQGAFAGRNAVGEPAPYDSLPYFYSDQYDLVLEYVGYADPGDEVVIRGDLRGREFIAFYHRAGVVTAAMTVNVPNVVEDLRRIVRSERPIELSSLAESGAPLATLG